MINSAKKNVIKKVRQGKIKTLPPQIISLIEEKKEVRKTMIKTNNPELKTKYNILTKRIKSEIEDHYNKHWLYNIEKANRKSSSKPLWDNVNKFRTGKSSKNIPNLIFGDNGYESDKGKTELFAEILGETFNNTNKFDETFDREVEYEVKKFKQNDCDVNANSIPLFTLSELDDCLSELRKGAPGFDKVNNLYLKNISEEFKLVLLKLFNNCLKEGKIPDDWKRSRINMIPKKSGLSNDPNEYRPISLTSCLCKLFERLLIKRTVDFLETNKILLNSQSGFRKHR